MLSRLRSNWLKITSAICTLAIAFGAFYYSVASPKKVEERKALVNDWYFNGESAAQILQPSAWQTTPPNEQCSNSPALPLPCHFITDEPLADANELMAYFEDRYGDDVEAITADADTRKPEP